MRTRSLIPVAVGLVFLLAASACGGKKSNAVSKTGKAVAASGSPGERIFISAGCSGCHTMAVAGAKGTVGPNLDELRPNQQTVEKQVRDPELRAKLIPDYRPGCKRLLPSND